MFEVLERLGTEPVLRDIFGELQDVDSWSFVVVLYVVAALVRRMTGKVYNR